MDHSSKVGSLCPAILVFLKLGLCGLRAPKIGASLCARGKAGLEHGILLIRGTSSKGSRPAGLLWLGQTPRGARHPAVYETDECLPASGTVDSVNSSRGNYMLHGRAFQNGVFIYLACLRSLSIVGDLCAGPAGSPQYHLPLFPECYLSALPAQAGRESLSQFPAQECHPLHSVWDWGPGSF